MGLGKNFCLDGEIFWFSLRRGWLFPTEKRKRASRQWKAPGIQTYGVGNECWVATGSYRFTANQAFQACQRKKPPTKTATKI
jgi:hypothetical protein